MANGEPGSPPLEGQDNPQNTQPLGSSPEDINKAVEAAGFKSVDALVKSQKEAHRKITELGQTNSELSKQNEELTALARAPRGPIISSGTDEGDPATVAAKVATQTIMSNEVETVLAEEPPGRRNRIRQLMLEDIQRNPHLERLPNAVRTLRDRARTTISGEAEVLVKSVFGEDATIEGIRQRLGGSGSGANIIDDEGGGTKQDKLNAGFVPEGEPGAAGGGSGKSYEQREKEKYRKAQGDGDVDTVTDVVFRDTDNIMKGF